MLTATDWKLSLRIDSDKSVSATIRKLIKFASQTENYTIDSIILCEYLTCSHLFIFYEMVCESERVIIIFNAIAVIEVIKLP